jgi:chemotaxis protein CheD
MSDIVLHPGDWHFGAAPTCIRTLLGSCVAITLWHPQMRLGGMCHFVLPSRPGRGAALDARYGDEAVDLLLAEIRSHGLKPGQFQARLFGGGDMFPGMARPGVAHVGLRNAQTARALILRAGAALVESDLAGIGHRSLVFELSSGSVQLKRN